LSVKTPRSVNLAGGSELHFADASVPAVVHRPEIVTCDDARVTSPGDHQDPRSAADPRFALANERTYLAYVRTALAVLAGGVAVIGYAPDGHVVRAAGIGLLVAGFAALIGGHLRWRHVDAAIRSGAAIHASRLPVVLTATLTLTVVVALAAALAAR
jgi:putative membrane protein